MPSTVPKGAKRQDGMGYPPEGLHLLRLDGNFSRSNSASADEILASEKIIEELKLRDLAKSIARDGQILPVAICEDSENVGVIVDGARRYLAIRLINMSPEAWGLKAPLPLRAYKMTGVDDEKRLELNLVANLNRLDLSVVDRAKIVQDAINLYDWTQERIADVMGCSPSSVGLLLKISKLPSRTKALVKSGKITPAAARAMIGLPEEDVRSVTKEIEQGASLKAVMANVKRKRRDVGQSVRRTMSELRAAIGEFSGSVRAEALEAWLSGDDGVDLSEVLGDNEMVPSQLMIGGKVVEVHEEAS